jgi:hypothetical protein
MTLPRFQQLQARMSQAVRNPRAGYNTHDLAGNSIEQRRISIYQNLFFNNIEQFFSHLFPVCRRLLSNEQWHDLIKDYVQNHYAHTPLFHQLGQEFLQYLKNQQHNPSFSEKTNPVSPSGLLELAHYEWVELGLSVLDNETQQNQELAKKNSTDTNLTYQLSDEVWPLFYNYAVHQTTTNNDNPTLAAVPTFLLAQRIINQDDQKVIFHVLTPALYMFLMCFQSQPTVPCVEYNGKIDGFIKPYPCRLEHAFKQLAEILETPIDDLVPYMQEALTNLVEQGWLHEI